MIVPLLSFALMSHQISFESKQKLDSKPYNLMNERVMMWDLICFDWIIDYVVVTAICFITPFSRSFYTFRPKSLSSIWIVCRFHWESGKYFLKTYVEGSFDTNYNLISSIYTVISGDRRNVAPQRIISTTVQSKYIFHISTVLAANFNFLAFLVAITTGNVAFSQHTYTRIKPKMLLLFAVIIDKICWKKILTAALFFVCVFSFVCSSCVSVSPLFNGIYVKCFWVIKIGFAVIKNNVYNGRWTNIAFS